MDKSSIQQEISKIRLEIIRDPEFRECRNKSLRRTYMKQKLIGASPEVLEAFYMTLRNGEPAFTVSSDSCFKNMYDRISIITEVSLLWIQRVS